MSHQKLVKDEEFCSETSLIFLFRISSIFELVSFSSCILDIRGPCDNKLGNPLHRFLDTGGAGSESYSKFHEVIVTFGGVLLFW